MDTIFRENNSTKFIRSQRKYEKAKKANKKMGRKCNEIRIISNYYQEKKKENVTQDAEPREKKNPLIGDLTRTV